MSCNNITNEYIFVNNIFGIIIYKTFTSSNSGTESPDASK